MSKRWAIFWGMLALPSLCAVSCSGRVADPSVSSDDAGSTGSADAAPEHDSGLENSDCSKLTVGHCAAGNDCQVLEAQLQAPRCASDFEAVGCASTDASCGAAETRAADPQGRQWLFLSTCIPFGWRLLAPTAPDACGVGGAAN
jgi:hypothetical protein